MSLSVCPCFVVRSLRSLLVAKAWRRPRAATERGVFVLGAACCVCCKDTPRFCSRAALWRAGNFVVTSLEGNARKSERASGRVH
ncbi:uncharacterized protein K452DRAFT_292066 [Aplosporella prunicola CBS 121167]|uniref:Uncharacterized protein n=1 Tax=Aplosporella prunicola CBS 121167 TaxID=1176127 RepID=A0A6A6B0U5_9PEZI|nr:uncharacterized protein K452DRAFT_292066 [Aplosporella prunicola CBS 121167]KAF2136844.1 hypothetical protein K452DRAFT_292066 [Aplosporella prunicola CBS 121167]